ncbi:MAG: DNA internalization-related competence protein ComEC/Rec2 [Gammaproteobacteria bacterium]|nr:DNA internalization-related competence protein ComEC/Rec2 [Gammaproteobacteria bacterium]
MAAQHSTLPLSSDHSSLLLVASLCLLSVRRFRSVALFLGAYALFMFAAGEIIAQRLDSEFAGDSMLTRVRIADWPKSQGESVVMRVEPVDDARIPPRVRLSWFNPPHLPAIGEVWELEVRLQRPRGTLNPGVFDYETWLFREKIHATGYVVAGKRNRLLWSGSATWLERFRADFARRANAAAASDDAAAVLAAVGAGLRHQVSREQWDRFAISGTSHLMAISGLHVGLAALAAFLVAFATLGPLPGHRNCYVGAVLVGTGFALAYALLSGFGVPARRAVIMLAVVAFTVVRRRVADPAVAVALAGVLVFLADPVATMTPGFHLSFAAVVALLWLARRNDVGLREPRWLRAPRQLLVMQVFLLFGLLPLTALIFNRFATMATPVNLIAVPVFSVVVVPLTLAALVVSPWSEVLGQGLLSAAAHVIDVLDAFIERMVALPHANTLLAEIRGVAWLFIWLPLAWVILPRGWPGRRIAVLGVVAVLAWRPAPPPEGCFDSWILDVGQGLAVVIETHDGVMLFDTGMAWRSGGSVAEQSILPFLRSRRIARIDWLVISHADLDHSGGLDALQKGLDVGTVMAGESLAKGAAQQCVAGQKWSSARVDFAVLHPGADAPGSGNASSCVVRVSAGDYGLLLTGDIEAGSERELIQGGANLASAIVVVPHHGSLTSSTLPFTNSVRPDYAVVSAGYANRWGFPKRHVVERWQAQGAEVLNTAVTGAVHFRVCAHGGVVGPGRERQRRHRFWHAAT